MNIEERSKCLEITQKLLTQPLGEFAMKVMSNYLAFLPNQPSFEQIKNNLVNYEFSSIHDWYNEVVKLFTSLSRFCDRNFSVVCDTLIQMINDELCKCEWISKDEICSDLRHLIKDLMPNSKQDFFIESPNEVQPDFHNENQFKDIEFTPDEIEVLQQRVNQIRSSSNLRKISQIILFSVGNENCYTQIKGGLSVSFQALSPYTLKLIKTFCDRIEKEGEEEEEC